MSFIWICITLLCVLAVTIFAVSKSQRATKVFLYGIFVCAIFMAALPIIWLAYSSFKPLSEIALDQLALPKKWTFENYSNAWRLGKLGGYLVNSFIYTIGTTAVVIVLSLMTSFAFAKIYFKISVFIKGLFMIGILITLQTLLIPLFLAESKIPFMYGSHLGILLPYIGISLPIAIYLGSEYIKGIPDAIIESARIDGATYFRIFTSIIFPMCKPVSVTIGIMTVLSIWNEFMFVFVLSGGDATRSLPVGIYAFSGPLGAEYGMQYAALMIGLAPLLIFYVFFHRRITEGFMAGALKG